MEAERMIVVTVRSVDGHRKKRTFKTLFGAAKWAQEWVGRSPTLGSGYAVSDDGVCVVEVSGATLNEVFPNAW